MVIPPVAITPDPTVEPLTVIVTVSPTANVPVTALAVIILVPESQLVTVAFAPAGVVID